VANLNGFNAAEIEPTAGIGPVPGGTYVAVIVESQMKPTKAGTGEYLELTLEIVEGTHKGRRVWERLNLKNPNETAVRIAQQTLSAICRAVGVMSPKDSVDLHNRPMSVVIEEEERDGRVSNKVKAYRSVGPSQPARPAATTQAAPPPWKR
jgi:hypothetical protein